MGDGLEAQNAALIEENAGLRAAVATQAALIANLVLEVAQLKARLGMNSKNSSKPPSSDGYSKPAPKSRRGRSGNKPGKQPGAPGHNLPAAADPEIVIDHVPGRCGGCGNDLAGAPVTGEVRRQVFDLPAVTATVTEHRAQRRRCGCGTETTAPFPPDATGTTCYGPNLRALVCYLVVRQHIPIARVAELLRDAYRIPVSTGTIVAMVQQGAEMLDAFLNSLRDTLAQAGVVHVDETGLRVAASLHWVHSASTAMSTLYHLDTRRGTVAIDAMGVLARLCGVVVHDGWTPYRKYDNVTHALCNAHHLRELDGAAETEGQQWATEMIVFLAATWQRVLTAKATGATSLDADQLANIRASYNTIITAGHAANPAQTPTGKRGRPKKTKPANLLARLDTHADDVLRFTTNFNVPFDNNEAERQIRMVKVQQKISGGFRTNTGATAWLAVRSYIATAIKNGINPLAALQRLTIADPWMPPAPDTG